MSLQRQHPEGIEIGRDAGLQWSREFLFEWLGSIQQAHWEETLVPVIVPLIVT